MTLTPFAVREFSGLNLVAEADEVGPSGAVDLLNVDLDKTGAVRTRDGYSQFTSVPTANSTFLHNYADTHLLVAYGSTVGAFTSSGSTVTTSATDVQAATNYSTATADYVFMGRTNSASGLLRWDGTSFTTPAWTGTTPRGQMVATSPWDNRLVAAQWPASGAGTNANTVRFSDPGDPLTWGANNYVDLLGEADNVCALAVWRDFLFVFCQKRFVVFYGVSTDGTGNPVFNYRSVTGIGVGPQFGGTVVRSVAVAPDGVYFANERGIYLTTGGPPQYISEPVEGLFRNTLSPFFTTSAAKGTGTHRPLLYHNNRLFFGFTTGSSASTDSYTLVHDIVKGTWTLWNIPICAGTRFIRSGQTRSDLLFGCRSGINGSFYLDGAATTDNGTAIASRYRSGFYGVGNKPSQEAVIRESVLSGIGTPTFSVASNMASSLPTTGGGAKAVVILGTSPAYAQGRHRISQKGRTFGYQIEASSGAWRVNSITQHIRGVRPPGLKST